MDTQEYRAMTKEDKHILLKSFCEALPYHTICHTHNGDYELLGIDIEKEELRLDAPVYDEGDDIYNIYCYGDVMPYLRPMSSMTEEEDKEFALLQTDFYVDGFLYPIAATNMINWLNAHHFDYRGLIPMGLALEAEVCALCVEPFMKRMMTSDTEKKRN